MEYREAILEAEQGDLNKINGILDGLKIEIHMLLKYGFKGLAEDKLVLYNKFDSLKEECKKNIKI